MAVSIKLKPKKLTPANMSVHAVAIAKKLALWDDRMKTWIVHHPVTARVEHEMPYDEQLAVAMQLHEWFKENHLQHNNIMFHKERGRFPAKLVIISIITAE